MNASTLTKNQTREFSASWEENGEHRMLFATVRYDDRCGNGHNTFSITGEMYRGTNRTERNMESCGCLHEEIAARIPKLAPYIRWHLCSSDGPLHYVANTVYHASDKDYHGKSIGDPIRVNYYVQDSSGLLVLWPEGGEYRKPKIREFDSREEAQEVANSIEGAKVVEWVLSRSEGKERELDAARSAAIWPDATDEDLTAPGLEERLKRRLPTLMDEFRQAVESLGFTW